MTNAYQIPIGSPMRRFGMLIFLGTVALLCGAGGALVVDPIVVYTMTESARMTRYSDEEKITCRDRVRYLLLVNLRTYEYRKVYLLLRRLYNPDSSTYDFSDFVETTKETGCSYLTLSLRGPCDWWEYGDNANNGYAKLDTVSGRVRSLRH